jgi:hypothetical protein
MIAVAEASILLVVHHVNGVIPVTIIRCLAKERVPAYWARQPFWKLLFGFFDHMACPSLMR